MVLGQNGVTISAVIGLTATVLGRISWFYAEIQPVT